MKDALCIQLEQLSEWAKVLQPQVYVALLNYAVECNKRTTEPYLVFRGSDITTWVQNYMIQH